MARAQPELSVPLVSLSLVFSLFPLPHFAFSLHSTSWRLLCLLPGSVASLCCPLPSCRAGGTQGWWVGAPPGSVCECVHRHGHQHVNTRGLGGPPACAWPWRGGPWCWGAFLPPSGMLFWLLPKARVSTFIFLQKSLSLWEVVRKSLALQRAKGCPAVSSGLAFWGPGLCP